MDSFELEHAKEILSHYFYWARGKNEYGHCLSVEWQYKNGCADNPRADPKYNEESMSVVNRVFGLMSIDLRRLQLILKAHYLTNFSKGKIVRAAGMSYSSYEMEIDKAALCFYNRLKKYCRDRKHSFDRLFLV